MNRLTDATSPYLRQHADNPVDWWPWCPEVFAEAARRDVPVFLSVGYAACHWCHVMAHESFEDEHLAAFLNAHFVSIKVDREERPDVDAVYMTATQAMTGQGGWPMSCFLTPEGEPFYCGTYFPPAPMRGMPSFRQVTEAVRDAWRERAAEVRESAATIAGKLAEHASPLPRAEVDEAAVDAALGTLAAEFDAETGGFGGAPKFPPSMVLEFLLRHHERTGSADALRLVQRCGSAMAQGGIYDQLAGGFARYSVDANWVVPHFEKMLYDNALLLRAYTHLARRTGSAQARRIAEETAGFLVTGMRTAEGAFAASFDADTDGVEGLTYVWTPAQLVEVLGAEDGAWAAELFGVTEQGTFEAGSSTLCLAEEPADRDRFERVRTALLAARANRPQPACDDKVVTEWNGLAITALAEAGAAFGRDDLIATATGAAEFLMRVHLIDGRLVRTSRHGVAGTAAGVLGDYGCLATALLTLHQVAGETGWLERAGALLDIAVRHFRDGEGAWFDTADDTERLITRPADPGDNASPSGAAAVTEALLTASALDPERGYRGLAEEAVQGAGVLARRAPRFAGHWLSVAEAMLAGPVQVAVVGADRELYRTAVETAAGGSVVVHGAPGQTPLLADRPLLEGRPTAYVCRGFVCDRPVTDPAQLRDQLVRQE
ncbi:thioredoxin domain-containing protein [Sciscionella marina]|uniref:thioredoxin domain-containing protein n=1 Tax=Sciscionella marina TaxID=508770 RepID=UPI00037AFEDD|nr:thioredoxin domain-containing protein [Sciscionella marina]